MKENPYDNQEFFVKYSQFPRSVEGLQAAGEWQELSRMLPSFRGKRVLDIGCGFGWHCRHAAHEGADSVLGIDISEKMLEAARERTDSPKIQYGKMAMEDMDFPPDSFDVVISSLVFHYTPDFQSVCKTVNRLLCTGGHFVFSVEHPIFTANETQSWHCDGNGVRIHWPVDNYFMEGRRETIFLGEKVTKYHKTHTSYVQALLETNFALTKMVEPRPPQQMLDTIPDAKDELRRPMMLLMAAIKL